jgi:hypothetical protein
MSSAAPAVLLIAPAAARIHEDDVELEQRLDRDRVAELRAALVAHAQAWGRKVAPDAFHVADRDEPLSEEISRVFAGHDGPLLIVWPWLAQLRTEHASGALGDLAAGCDVVLGPVIDGGLYLLGLARPLPALLAVPEGRWQGPDVMTTGFAIARDAGLEVGILRAERALRTSADVRAALADPLLEEEIARILAAG